MFREALFYIFCFIQVTFAFTLPFNQKEGSSSFQILKLNLSPETVAWSGSGVAFPYHSVLSLLELIPVATADTSSQIAFSQTYPFSEFKAQVTNLGFLNKDKRNAFFCGLRYLSFEPIERFDDEGKKLVPYSSYALKLQSGYSLELNSKLSLGFSLSFVLNNIEQFFYKTVVLDFGMRYQITKNLSFSGSLTNADIWVISSQPHLFSPTNLQAGVAYRFLWAYKMSTDFLIDIKSSIDKKFVVPIGIGFGFNELFWLRIGSPFFNSDQTGSLGFGLNFFRSRFDYAIQIHNTLSSSHFFSLSLKF